MNPSDRVTYSYVYKVRTVEERFLTVRVDKGADGGPSAPSVQSLGWFITLDPGGLTLSCSRWIVDGNAMPRAEAPPPEYAPGARVKLTMEVLR